jgi:hypothetical protein
MRVWIDKKKVMKWVEKNGLMEWIDKNKLMEWIDSELKHETSQKTEFNKGYFHALHKIKRKFIEDIK